MVVQRQITKLTIQDLERRKFELNDKDEVIIRTSAEGTFIPSGMSDFRITTMDITDTASKIPAVALTDRKSLSIINLNTTDSIYLGKSDVTADSITGTTSGWPIFPNSVHNIDFSGGIDVYGRAESGKTVQIKVIEYV